MKIKERKTQKSLSKKPPWISRLEKPFRSSSEKTEIDVEAIEENKKES